MSIVPQFSSRLERNRYLVEQGVAVDEATADGIADIDLADEGTEDEGFALSFPLEENKEVECGDDATDKRSADDTGDTQG